jgi:hypothetical protein
MPIYLEPVDISHQLKEFTSVLIVFCPICPPISLSMQKHSACLELSKRGFKSVAFQDHVRSIRESLEDLDIKTGVFSTYLPCPTMCLWTKGQRERLRNRAKDYEAAVVLGCDTARYTARQALQDTDCQVFQAMRMTGLTNAIVKFRFPMTVTLEEKTRVAGGGNVSKVP